ncbi:MAG: hypothetical protein ACF8TS_05805 [Maioricimonas sp. JB049]
MKRVVEHELTPEQRERHRQVREAIADEQAELAARDRAVCALRELAAESRSVLQALEQGAATPEQMARLRDSVERAEGVLSDEAG